MEEQTTNKAGPKPIDAAVKISISRDYLEAKLFIEPPKYHGAEANAERIDRAVNEAGIKYGIDTELLKQIKLQPQYSREYLIARGKASVSGEDGSIRYCVELKPDVRPKLREDGTVDYRNLGIVRNVNAGDLLAEIKLPTKGEEGIAVTGNKLTCAAGRAVGSPVGRNTELSSDGTKLTAKLSGHFTFEGTRINIADTFVVPNDVDNATGNIFAVCNVSVCGNLLEGFVVEAQGNVDIGGTVEGGTIKCGGKVTIHGGIVGRGHSRIECKGDFSSTFIENCEVNTGGSIKAESIMNSNVKCGGKLELIGMRAIVMGGRCVVGQDLIANQIGSQSLLRTELVLGVDPAVMTRYASISAELKQLRENVIKLKQIVDLLGKYEKEGKLPASKMKMYVNSKISLVTSERKIESDTQEYNSLSGLIQNSGTGKVICRGIMYRGVKLTIGGDTMDVTSEISTSSFSLVDGRIAISPTSAY